MVNNGEYNVVSLFSGCGGLDIGVSNAGNDELNTDTENSLFNFIWSNDAMEHACKSLSNNFNKKLEDDIENLGEEKVVYNGDIREVDFNEAMPIYDPIDLVMGGFPCQDFSILRGDDNRDGIDVERGKLYLEFARALATLQPKIFVAENVKGLTSANDGKAYEQILDDFENLDQNWSEIESDYERDLDVSVNTQEMNGYNILHSEVVDFSNLGVPQGRKRLIIIGLRNDISDSISDNDNKKSIDDIGQTIKQNLSSDNPFNIAPLSTIEAFTGESLNENSKRYKKVMEPYADYITEIDSERSEKYREEIWPEYTFNIWEDYKWRNGIDTSIDKKEVIESHKELLNELSYRNENLSNLSFEDDSNEEMREQSHVLERLKHIPPDENHRMVKGTDHHVSGMMSNIYRRVHPLQYSPTIIASGGGGTWGYHYKIDRGKLTNRERARIQTFPDDFIFHGTNAEVRKQIGNAVPPLGAKRIGECLLDIFESID